MAKPWEEYQDGPWSEYANKSERPNLSGFQSGQTPHTKDVKATRKQVVKQKAQRMSAPQRFIAGASNAVGKPIVGAAQMLGIAPEWTQREMDRLDAESEGLGTAGKVGGVVGDALTWAAPGGAIGKIGAIGKAGQKASQAIANVGVGAVAGGLQPIHDGESRAQNAAWGGAAAGVGHGLASAIGGSGARAAAQAVPATNRQLAKRAIERGIPVTAAQVSDAPLAKVAGSISKHLPFSGASGKAAAQQGAFNRAVTETFGESADNISDDLILGAKSRIGAGYDDIYSRNNIPLSPEAMSQLGTAKQQGLDILTADQGDVLSRQLDSIINTAENGVLSGPKYQALRSQLLRAETNGGALGEAVRGVRSALDNIADGAVGGDDAAALATLRGQYRNLKLTEKALAQVEGAKGNVRPASLWNLSNGKYGATPEMRELAKIGQVVLKDPIPDSGTAQRLMTMLAVGGPLGLAGGIPMLLQGAAAGATIGRAANSNALARFMLRENPGAWRQQASEGLGALSRYASVPMGVATMPLMPWADEPQE
ncbi:hypothetical protein V3390_09160 [Luteimonas sp. FXH3W]|uniref:Uncharacterized protein n=1 Tax=Aquilutibacter rugosus TaxID=3115820 RepID=A0ABU7V1H9_9GAMM